MRVPERLEPLVEQGVIDEVVRPLMSGKEAQVYLVSSDGELRVAKVYKEASQRSFKHRADYTEGRKVRNARTQRAMSKRSKFGREQMEASWRNAEVDVIYRLRAAGVRVPEPYDFVDGVLVMEMIVGADGQPAPRLVDVDLDEDEARDLFNILLTEIVRMLLAGVVHGDLSDFNILLGPDGPVIIDFPQAVDPAHNNNARKLLERDVDNVTQFLARSAPELKKLSFGAEMWDLYERHELTEHTRLTGKWKPKHKPVEVSSLLAEIEELEREAMKRRESLGLPPPRPARAPQVWSGPAPTPAPPGEGKKRKRKRKGGGGAPPSDGRSDGGPAPRPAPRPPSPPPAPRDAAPRERRDDLDDFDLLLSIDD